MAFFIGLTLCLLILIATINCDTFPQCTGVPSQSFVASPEGCGFYIYCDGEDSFQDLCPENLLFNLEESSCDLADNVQCILNAETVSTTLLTTSTTTPISTSVPPSASSTGSTLTPTSPPSGQIVCPAPSKPDEISYLPDPESCTNYYMCYRETAIPLSCPNELQFNSFTGSCDWAQSANCKIEGTTTVSPREQCTGQSSGYFVYPNNCHYYYRCTNGMLTIQECPLGFGWDSGRKMCTTTGCAH